MMSVFTAEEITKTYPTFVVEGLLGEVVTIAVPTETDIENFGRGLGVDPDFDYGLIVNLEDNSTEGFWFERGYWVKS